jgi:beta-glucosidase
MTDRGFPNDFLWGAASAAVQIEGAYTEDGKGLSIWDIAPKKKIKNGENCHQASDHYHHYKEDVAMMKELGLTSYRFSVSWPRVIPEKGVVNPKGLAFYVNLVNELKSAGIEPLCTLYHWDLPVWVHKEGGWKNKKIIGYFAEYVKIVVDALSDSVQWWMTMNEPQCFIMNGYTQGNHAPFKRNLLSLFKLTRNALLAHGRAVKVIREHAKLPPKIGWAMASGCFVPEDESEMTISDARDKTFGKGIGLLGNCWWMDPAQKGSAPKPLKYFLSKKDMAEIFQPLDFVGVNVYQPFNFAPWGGDPDRIKPGMPRTSMDWLVMEETLYWTIRFVYERYHLPVMVTENGMAENDVVCLDGKVHDPQRADFIYRYLRNVKRAVNEDIPVLGYQHWAVMDNFEWAEGYNPRFGLIYVDYETQKRIIKDSGYAYAHIIETNGSCL